MQALKTTAHSSTEVPGAAEEEVSAVRFRHAASLMLTNQPLMSRSDLGLRFPNLVAMGAGRNLLVPEDCPCMCISEEATGSTWFSVERNTSTPCQLQHALLCVLLEKQPMCLHEPSEEGLHTVTQS